MVPSPPRSLSRNQVDSPSLVGRTRTEKCPLENRDWARAASGASGRKQSARHTAGRRRRRSGEARTHIGDRAAQAEVPHTVPGGRDQTCLGKRFAAGRGALALAHGREGAGLGWVVVVGSCREHARSQTGIVVDRILVSRRCQSRLDAHSAASDGCMQSRARCWSLLRRI